MVGFVWRTLLEVLKTVSNKRKHEELRPVMLYKAVKEVVTLVMIDNCGSRACWSWFWFSWFFLGAMVRHKAADRMMLQSTWR